MEFKVVKELGQLGSKKKPPFFKLVSWNGRGAKFDVRKWGEDGTPFKGISFNVENGPKLLELINEALEDEKSDDVEEVYEMSGKEVLIHRIYGCFEEGKFDKQLTYINWGTKPKYDLRGWTEEYDKCSKGITLDDEELKDLKDLLEKEINIYM